MKERACRSAVLKHWRLPAVRTSPQVGSGQIVSSASIMGVSTLLPVSFGVVKPYRLDSASPDVAGAAAFGGMSGNRASSARNQLRPGSAAVSVYAIALAALNGAPGVRPKHLAVGSASDALSDPGIWVSRAALGCPAPRAGGSLITLQARRQRRRGRPLAQSTRRDLTARRCGRCSTGRRWRIDPQQNPIYSNSALAPCFRASALLRR